MLSFLQLFGNNRDGDPHPEYDRNIKKVRFNDHAVDVDEDRDLESQSVLSWKDKLVGAQSGESALDRSTPNVGCENDFELLEEDDAVDYNRALMQGSWVVYGQYLTVQPWTRHFSPPQPYPSIVLAWIRLPNLLGYLYKWKIIEAIGGLIRKVVKLDEAFPTVCFVCGKYGHVKGTCPSVAIEKNLAGLCGEPAVEMATPNEDRSDGEPFVSKKVLMESRSKKLPELNSTSNFVALKTEKEEEVKVFVKALSPYEVEGIALNLLEIRTFL
ncbi:hypothetical protein GOBAR_AA04016 [Gossypium barbadense]|uniref:CCHC-type domain-containing protein n=1 Tax=Gossypium barbadense TaxID=3634 RepID=A0A2P5YLT6_GOSBA|nr:hypothetical protein GOBAR_AA04016 [Gossypium barbadense]